MTAVMMPPERAGQWLDAQATWVDPHHDWLGRFLPTWTVDHGLIVDGQLWCHTDKVVIRHGRGDHMSQPSSATLNATLTAAAAADMSRLKVGQSVTLQVTVGRADVGPTVLTRFVGVITDIDWDHPEGGGRIIAVDRSGGLSRLRVGDQPWPQHTDVARVDAIMAAAGISPAEYVITGPTMVSVLARDVDSQKVWGLLADLASDTVGVVWVDTDGVIRFDTGLRRDTPDPAHLMDTCDLLDDVRWSLNDDYTSRVTVSNDEGGEAVATSPTVPPAGHLDVDRKTEVISADLAEVAARALQLNSEPRWHMNTLTWSTDLPRNAEQSDPIPIERIAGPMLWRVGDRVQLTGSLPSAPQPWPETMFVEGWQEEHTPGRVVSRLTVVDRFMFLNPPPPVINLRTVRVDTSTFDVLFTMQSDPDITGAIVATSKTGYPTDPAAGTLVPAAPDEAVAFPVTGNDETTLTYVAVWAQDADSLLSQREITDYIGMPTQQVTITETKMVQGNLRLKITAPNDPAITTVRVAYNRGSAVPDPATVFKDVPIAAGQSITYTYPGGVGSRTSDVTIHAAAWAAGVGGLAPLAPSRGSTLARATSLTISVNGRNASGSSYGWENSNRVRHGNTSSNTYRGVFVYGTKIADALQGRTITGVSLQISRGDGGPGGSMSVRCGTHAHTSVPGGRPTISNQFDVGGVPRNSSSTYGLPNQNGHWTGLSSGSVRGYGFIWDSTDVNRTYVGGSGTGGTLVITHNDYAN